MGRCGVGTWRGVEGSSPLPGSKVSLVFGSSVGSKPKEESGMGKL